MPGVFNFCVHFGDEFFPRHAGPPLLGRLELHHGLKHRERRGVGRGVGLAGFAENAFHFRESAQQAVLDLQNTRGFFNGHARHGGRHEKDRAFVQRRHEFLAQFLKRIDGRRQNHQRRQNREPAETQAQNAQTADKPRSETGLPGF